MSAVRQRIAQAATRGGIRLARRRLERARSLRWAVRVPMVTLTVGATLAALVATGEIPARRARRRRSRLR